MSNASAVAQRGAQLTRAEEQLFRCVRGRVRTYFQDFEELEGFTVLGENLQRLETKVEFELRGVFLHHHDAVSKAEQVQAKLDEYKQELDCQQTVCDQVIAAARQLARNAPEALERRTDELQAFYSAELKLQEKQWAVQADERLHSHVRMLSEKYARQLEFLELEHTQRVVAMKEELRVKKDAEIEYLRVQMRLQLTSQLDRETHDLLGANGRQSHRARAIRNYRAR